MTVAVPNDVLIAQRVRNELLIASVAADFSFEAQLDESGAFITRKLGLKLAPRDPPMRVHNAR